MEMEMERECCDTSKVSVICIDCEDSYIDAALAGIEYSNLDVVKTVSGFELLEDVFDYANKTDSKYITFLLPEQKIKESKIELMVEMLEKAEGIDVVICNRCFEHAGKTIAQPDMLYSKVLRNQIVAGKILLEKCITDGVNLYGNLTTLMIRTDSLIARLSENGFQMKTEGMMTVLLNYLLLSGSNLVFIVDSLVASGLSDYNEGLLRQKLMQYEKMLSLLKREQLFGGGVFRKRKNDAGIYANAWRK